jgi:hypothetical protein
MEITVFTNEQKLSHLKISSKKLIMNKFRELSSLAHLSADSNIWFRKSHRVMAIISILALSIIFTSCAVKENKKVEQLGDLNFIGQLQTYNSNEISGSQWGVSCHWIVDEHELTTDQQVEQLSWLGAKYGFLCSDWDRVETEKGKYDFNTTAHKFDEAVFGMAKRNIEPVIQIYGGNRLYMPFLLDPNKRQMADADLLLNDSETRAAWTKYIKAMVTRYKDHVKVWEIWNEPNGDFFWQKDGKRFEPSVEVYGSVLKLAATTIRSVQPEAIIIAGSTAHVKMEYLKGFLNSEGGDYYDFWSVHPYGELPEAYDPIIIEVQEMLKKYGKTSVMWQSECGFPSSGDTGGWGWGGPWDETKQAKWVLRRLLSDAMVGLTPSIYFALNDYPARIELGPDAGKMGVNRKGLFANNTWKPKMSAYAFRNLSSLINNQLEAVKFDVSVEMASPKPSISDSIRTYTMKEKTTGSPVILYWFGVNIQTDFTTLSVNVNLQNETIDNPVIVDLLSGKIYDISVGKKGQKIFKGLPITDSPLVLCSRNLIDIISE